MIYESRFQIFLKKYQKKRIDLDSKSRESDSLKISTPTESRSSTPKKFRLLRSRRVRLPKIYDSSGVEEFDSFQISTLFGLTTPNSWSPTPKSESGVVSLYSTQSTTTKNHLADSAANPAALFSANNATYHINATLLAA